MENPNRTARLEAFSDGVFSIAITLLVFNIQVPRDLPEGETLFTALLELGPSYLAFFISFVTIGIMWINHHNLFKIINRTDHLLMVFNVTLLLLVTFVNFPTAVLSQYLLDETDGRVAALLLSGVYIAIAFAYQLLWYYAAYRRRLIDPTVPQAIVDGISRQYRFGPLLYLVAFLLAFVSVWASLGVIGLLALFFALPNGNHLFDGD